MNILSILIFVHVLLMVFWLGTDVGVFTSALRYIDARRPLAERKAVMDLGIVIDRFPRVCFVAMLPVGLQIAFLIGLVDIPAGIVAAVWATSAVWLGVVTQVIRLAGKPEAKPYQIVERVLLVCGGSVLILAGGLGLAEMLPLPGWFAGKLAVYGGICFFGLFLDHSFGPVVAAFDAIEAAGSTPERVALLSKRMWRSLSWVLAIYAAVLTAGFLGVVKP